MSIYYSLGKELVAKAAKVPRQIDYARESLLNRLDYQKTDDYISKPVMNFKPKNPLNDYSNDRLKEDKDDMIAMLLQYSLN